MLFALWLLSQAMGFALPALSSVAERDVPLQAAREQNQGGSHGYDAGSQSRVVYDAELPHRTTEGFGDFVAVAPTTPPDDLFSLATISVVGAPRTPPAENAGFPAAEGGTTLYRAVGPAELADIEANGALRNLGSAEGKYFTTSGEAASSYAKQAVAGFGDPPYTLIQTRVPNSIFEGLTPATVDRGIPAWVIPNNRLPGLTPQVLPTMPIPFHP